MQFSFAIFDNKGRAVMRDDQTGLLGAKARFIRGLCVLGGPRAASILLMLDLPLLSVG